MKKLLTVEAISTEKYRRIEKQMYDREPVTQSKLPGTLEIFKTVKYASPGVRRFCLLPRVARKIWGVLSPLET